MVWRLERKQKQELWVWAHRVLKCLARKRIWAPLSLFSSVLVQCDRAVQTGLGESCGEYIQSCPSRLQNCLEDNEENLFGAFRDAILVMDISDGELSLKLHQVLSDPC